ncbi:MAG: pyridoxamine 5'-phosphate oxidase family protein [Cyanobacteria bacterium]|nr:pyridoxamine 5'-phosphate oxidase family protein [Cyanobacteriota bacterium]MDA0865106.1 pyridoxamine 5'-phosphate oxidase family protein [Cyanobacteriota bacterium]
MSTANADNTWINTVKGQDPAVLTQARQIIAANIYCTLSTCSAAGWPWASPLFFAYNPNWHLYWSSAIASRHSQNLAQNQGRAAIAIYSTQAGEGKGQGLYLSGVAGELPPDQVDAVMQALFQRAGGDPPQRTAADYRDASPRRFYRFQPAAAWITGARLAVGNQLVDTKIELSLVDLRR